MPKVSINKFNGGIVNDPRDPSENVARMVTGFDILTNAYKMSPYHDSESGDSSASTSKKQNFCIALRTGTTYSLYALGVVSGTGRAEVMYKDITTGAANDLDDATWTATGNYQSASGSTNFELFVYYKKTGLVYGAKSFTHIWAYDPDGGDAFAETHQALTYTNIAQGIVHSKDDVLYIPYDNKIAKNDNGSWTVAAITLPTHLYITSITEFGNYLAIGCAPLSGVGDSVVFLWDRDSSLATLSDSINWGSETLKIIEEVGGLLIGISTSGGNSTRFQDRIVFKYLSVSNAIPFKTLEGGTATVLPIIKQKFNDRLYFMMTISLNGSIREGVWSVGRNSPNDPMSVVFERTPNNDTALTGGVMKGFFIIGDYMFISYVDNSAYVLSKTNDQASYTATSSWESTINPKMDSDDRTKRKQLTAVLLSYEPLPTAGQGVLKYRVDGGAYTTIFTETTDSVVVTEKRESFTEGREYEFKIESTGGAKITGFEYEYKVLQSQI